MKLMKVMMKIINNEVINNDNNDNDNDMMY